MAGSSAFNCTWDVGLSDLKIMCQFSGGTTFETNTGEDFQRSIRLLEFFAAVLCSNNAIC